jgi:nicotinamidase/pyrazinamidase
MSSGSSSTSSVHETTTTTTTLLLIDVQKDFHPGGSLAIPTAHDDAKRIAQLIRQSIISGTGANDSKSSGIQRVIATLDTHQKLHIAHGCFWQKGDKNAQKEEHPPPFTIISSQDVENGVWQPRSDLMVLSAGNNNNNNLSETVLDPTVFTDIETVVKEEEEEEDGEKTTTLDLQKYALEYTRRLERRGRFQLCIWPEHCLIGTTGHAMVDDVQQALQEWSNVTGRSVEWVFKGQHWLTEMYSALQADVPVSHDTAFNTKLLDSLLGDAAAAAAADCKNSSSRHRQNRHHRLLVCGQAKSHCVNYTVRDLVSRWPPHRVGEICLLQDCASAVPGFEDAARQFESDMRAAGVQMTNAANVAFSNSNSNSNPNSLLSLSSPSS